MDKLYTIGGKKFALKPYQDLTGFEDEEVTRLMDAEKTGAGTEIKINGYEIFPIILIPLDKDVDVNTFDWRHLTGRLIAEILVDFALEKKSSIDSIQNYMLGLTEKKLRQSQTTNTSTAEAGA